VLRSNIHCILLWVGKGQLLRRVQGGSFLIFIFHLILVLCKYLTLIPIHYLDTWPKWDWFILFLPMSWISYCNPLATVAILISCLDTKIKRMLNNEIIWSQASLLIFLLYNIKCIMDKRVCVVMLFSMQSWAPIPYFLTTFSRLHRFHI
jgi:hypothetical protein